MAPTMKQLTEWIHQMAPEELAMEWDVPGLQVGSEETSVHRVLVALDLTDSTLEEAIHTQSDVVLTHHPLWISPLQRIRTDQPTGHLIAGLLQNQIQLCVAHTNMDIVSGGLNDWIVEQLSLENIRVLQPTGARKYLKLAVFIPQSHVNQVADALALSGAGHIGNYSHCSFWLNGTGTFKPLEGSSPAIGAHGTLESVSEVRLETILPAENQRSVLEAMREAHPYEEVAYDLYALENETEPVGLGRVGDLKSPMPINRWTEALKQLFQIETMRHVEGQSTDIRRVAVLCGSGADAIGIAAQQGCDALVTGDIKYHDAQKASAEGLHLFDVGHFDSEKCFVPLMASYLSHISTKNGYHLQVLQSGRSKNPIRYV